MEQIETLDNLNGVILTNYQQNYPNLKNFSYDIATDSLIYGNDAIKLNGYGLSRVDPIFFLMQPDDIFAYFKNGFYYDTSATEHINDLYNRMLITENDINYLQNYAKKYKVRCIMYAHNKALFDAEYSKNANMHQFVANLLDERRVIESARMNANNNQSVDGIIFNAYMQNDNNSLGNNESMGNNLEKGISLTRNKPGNNSYFPALIPEENPKFTMSGFTSIILIVVSVITAGMYLALKLLS